LPGLKKSKFDRSKSENYDIILRYYWERRFLWKKIKWKKLYFHIYH
jgi:hypothetical protein